MKILGTGLSGLVGSRVTELLGARHTFTNLSLETGVDITDRKTVDAFVSGADAPWIFHFAAMTDVDGAERERPLGKKSKSWIINVEATRFVAEACRHYGKKLLYISTDFVFDGTKKEYSEDDAPNPQGWYAVTKYEGEKIVRDVPGSLIVRISNPYCARPARPDFVHKIMDRLSQNLPVAAPRDQLFLPTYIDDIALALELLVGNSRSGIFHVVGSGALSPYDVAVKLAKRFDFNQSLVSGVTFEEFFKGRAPRPQYGVLNNEKVTKLGALMSTFDERIGTIDLLGRL